MVSPRLSPRSSRRKSFVQPQLRRYLSTALLCLSIFVVYSLVWRSFMVLDVSVESSSSGIETKDFRETLPAVPTNSNATLQSTTTVLPPQSHLDQQQQILECDMQSDHPDIHARIEKQWNYIDTFINQHYNTSKVSGGIFLYPRQVSVLTDVICRIQKELQQQNRGMTICETGFGAGHSMAIFQSIAYVCGDDLTVYPPSEDDRNATSRSRQHQHRRHGRPPVNIVSMDKFDRPYQLQIWHYFKRTGSARGSQSILNEHVKGDSCQTVPLKLTAGPSTPVANHSGKSVQCDILHGSSLCLTDNIDLVENSPCGVLLTSTAMGDLTDRSVYFGPKAQWRILRDKGCITDIVCYQEDEGTLNALSQDFVFAKKGSNYTGFFCMAMTTGKCQKDKRQQTDSCDTAMHGILSKIRLNSLCPAYQVLLPP